MAPPSLFSPVPKLPMKRLLVTVRSGPLNGTKIAPPPLPVAVLPTATYRARSSRLAGSGTASDSVRGPGDRSESGRMSTPHDDPPAPQTRQCVITSQ
jgi:hypothetical protein